MIYDHWWSIYIYPINDWTQLIFLNTSLLKRCVPNHPLCMRLAHPDESVFCNKNSKNIDALNCPLCERLSGLGKLTWPFQSLQICENDLTPWVVFHWQSLGNTLRSRKLVCAGARSPQTTSPPPAISPPCLENSRFHFFCSWLFQCSGTAMTVLRHWCTCVEALVHLCGGT